MLRRIAYLGFAIAIAFPAVADDLTPAQVAERCENNRLRLAELNTQIAAIHVPTADEEKQAQDDLLSVGLIAGKGTFSIADLAEFGQISHRYGYDSSACGTLGFKACGEQLTDVITKLMMTSRNDELAQLKAEASAHETNLVALGCVAATVAIEGAWASNWGDMSFSGLSHIDGRWENQFNSGRIDATLEHSKLTGFWFAPAGGGRVECPEQKFATSTWGRLELTFAENGKSFTGKWGYCMGDLAEGSWNGERP